MNPNPNPNPNPSSSALTRGRSAAVAVAVTLVLTSLASTACADLKKEPASSVATAPKRPPTERVAYFRPATRSEAGDPGAPARDLREAVIPVAVQRHAELTVYGLNGNTFATGVPVAKTSYGHLSDNPDLRAQQITRATDALFEQLNAAEPSLSPVTNVVGVFRVAGALQHDLVDGGHLLVAVGGDAVPTSQNCDAQWASDDPSSADTLAASCLGRTATVTRGVEYWFLSAGQSADGRFREHDTVATRNLVAALVRRAEGRLCPFQPNAIAPGSCG